MNRSTTPMVLAALILLSCLLQATGEESDPLVHHSDGPTRAGPVKFVNVSGISGLSGVTGNHFSWGDFDNDGHEDLLIDGKRLFRNNGPPGYTFTEVTDHAGIHANVRSGVWGDFDNDGWLDIFCGGGNPSSDHPQHPDILWHNRRDGTFERIMPEAGAPWDTFPTVAAGWADMNRDGYLDLYMVNYENGSYSGYSDHFWLNNGDGTFINATKNSGMSEEDHPYQGRGVSWCDFDQNGFMDAYVSNYRIMPNYLYRNLGHGNMNEVASDLGVEGHGNDHPVTREGPYYGHSLGASWGDLDNDGDMDLWVTNLAHKDAWRGPICDDSYLFENLGEEEDWTFVDRRPESGIPIKEIPGALMDGEELMVSSALADYDNDGDLDLFIPQIYGDVSYAHSYLYRNEGGMVFTDVSSETGIKVWNTYGSAWCDYNEDGWIDLVTGGGSWDADEGSTKHQNVHLYRNEGSGSQWLEVQLEGRTSNVAAIGARVEVEVDQDGDGSFDLLCVREVQGGTAAQGQQDSMVLHFGLGPVVRGLKVTTHWPMGRTVVETNVSSNMRVRLFEPTDPIELDMDIIGFEPSGSGSMIQLSFQNPSDQVIDHAILELTFRGSPGIDGEFVTITDGIPPGRSVLEIRTVDWEKDEKVNITYSMYGIYPPIENTISGNFFFDPLFNILPVPILTASDRGETGKPVVISGEDSYDPDGTISGYRFEMGDGNVIGWTSNSRVEHIYNEPGTYIIRMSVRDDRNGISIDDSVRTIDIEGEGYTKPVAIILEIDPTEALIGEDVRFEGGGIAHTGFRITSYEWTSSIDGELSDRSAFETDDLSLGTHIIGFRVMDSEGKWSDQVSRQINITEPYEEPMWVHIHEPEAEGPYIGILEITGTTGPLFVVEKVEVRIDSGLWDNIWMVPDWKYRIDCTELDPGMHWIEVRAYSNGEYSDTYATLEIEVAEEEDPLESSTGAGSGGSVIQPPVWTIFIILALIVITIASVLVFLFIPGRRKRKDLLGP